MLKINQPKPFIAKVVLLGSQGVGKTSIVLRLNGYDFTEQLNPTIGAAFCRHELTVDSATVQLQIWDTAGQERFRAMAPMYYRNASAAFVVYDITCFDTFNEAKMWITELGRNIDSVSGPGVLICLVANKTDLEKQRQVESSIGAEYAQSINAIFCETSAVDNQGIRQMFEMVARQLLERLNNTMNSSILSNVSGLSLSDSSMEQRSIGRSCCLYRSSSD